MCFEMLDLPLAMIEEIVEYVDYNGLLALRQACKLMKRFVDEKCASEIRVISFVHDANTAFLQILPQKSRPPLFHYDYKDLITRNLIYEKQKLIVNDFPEFLEQFRATINRCYVHTFTFATNDEGYMSLMAAFLKDLKVSEKCLNTLHMRDWNTAIATVKRMKFNKALTSSDHLKIAEVVDSLMIYNLVFLPNLVSNILRLFSKRCKAIHWTGRITTNQVDHLIKALATLDKQAYFYSPVEESVERREKALVGSLYIEIGGYEHYRFLEISHSCK